MKPTRIATILVLAFLFGGGSAEVAVQAKRAIEQRRAERDEGSAGELIALEIHRESGELVARPRVIASPGRVSQILLRDPEDPGRIRLALRVETTREPSGDLALEYQLSMPEEELVTTGRVNLVPGVEQDLELGERPLTATVLAIPVPSAAFDAYLDAERAARSVSAI